ncbi:deoxyribodipyrimidine photolyase [soil metagenome]
MNAPASASRSGPPAPPSAISPVRIRALNDAPVRGRQNAPRESDSPRYVLYWMTSFRRLEWNHALERSVDWARHLGLPLLVFEPLRIGYRWASVRHHRFCLDGMREHAARLQGQRTGYYPYVEPSPDAGEGLLEALAARAALVVTDDAPIFFLPRMRAAAAPRLPVRLEAVDSNGILPLAQPGRDFTTAFSFRIHLHKTLPEWLEEGPAEHPLAGDPLPEFGGADLGALNSGASLSGASHSGTSGSGDAHASPLDRLRAGVGADIVDRWPPASPELLHDPALTSLPLDRAVPPVPFAGGRAEASRRLARFVDGGLTGYATSRNHPDRAHATGLSPHLHWGHVSSHEIVHAVLDREGWTPAGVAGAAGDRKPDGRRSGWWGLGADAEAFLDQVITWRELGFNGAWRSAEAGVDPEAYDTLPGWARETLAEHEEDPRPHVYTRGEFEEARTHDPLWNAAQRELRQEGTIHNYLRMLWGKKILEWSETPRDALATMIELNHRWGVDGRDPNSTSGIMWTLGRYDRGWPERAIYGKVRSMTSDSTRRKVELKGYLARFGDEPAGAAAAGADSQGSLFGDDDSP